MHKPPRTWIPEQSLPLSKKAGRLPRGGLYVAHGRARPIGAASDRDRGVLAAEAHASTRTIGLLELEATLRDVSTGELITEIIRAIVDKDGPLPMGVRRHRSGFVGEFWQNVSTEFCLGSRRFERLERSRGLLPLC